MKDLSRNTNSKIMWTIAVFILFAASFLRFYHLSQVGIYHSDTAAYSTFSRDWDLGYYEICKCKFGYYFLGSIAIKLIGFHDYTLLYLSAFLDILIIVLLFIICYKTGISPIISLCCACFYAFLPEIIVSVYSGLPHICSSFFLLLSIYFFILSWGGKSAKKLILLFISSSLLTFSAFIHPSLYYFIPVFGLLILHQSLDINQTNLFKHFFNKTFFIKIIIFIFSIFFTILLTAFLIRTNTLKWLKVEPTDFNMFIYEIADLKNSMFSHYNISAKEFGTYRQLMDTLKFIVELLTIPGLVFIIFTFIGFLFYYRKNIKSEKTGFLLKIFRNKIIFSFFISFLIYILIKSTISGVSESRIYVPFIPFLLICTAYCLQLIINKVNLRKFPYFLLILIIGISIFNICSNTHIIEKKPTIFRQMGNVLSGKINSGNRLLITPFPFYRDGDIQGIYLNENYVYRTKTIWKPEIKKLSEYNIRYIAVCKAYLDKRMQINSTCTICSTTDLLTNDIIDADYKNIYSGLSEMNVKQIYKSAELEIYKMNSNNTNPDVKIPDDSEPFFNVKAGNHVVELNIKNKY